MNLKEGFLIVKEPIDTPQGDTILYVVCAVPEVTNWKNPHTLKITMRPPLAVEEFSCFCYDESPVGKLIQQAGDRKLPVAIRIEKQRMNGVGADISILELTENINTAKGKVVKSCVGIYDFNNREWVLSNNTADVNKDPESVYQFLERCKEGDFDSKRIDHFFSNPKPKVLKPQNFDKQQQIITMYHFLLEKEHKYGYSNSEEHRRAFTLRLIALANKLQTIMRKSDIVDYGDYTHTRARYLIFNYEEHAKNLTEENINNFEKWLKECYYDSLELLKWADEVPI